MSADESTRDPLAAGEADDRARWTLQMGDVTAGNVETGVG